MDHLASRHIPQKVKALDLNKTNPALLSQYQKSIARLKGLIPFSKADFHNCNICRRAYFDYEDFCKHRSTHSEEQLKADSWITATTPRPAAYKAAPISDTESSEDEDGNEDDDSEPKWLRSGWYADDAREYAENALELFNELDGGKKYELVEPGPFSLSMIGGGPIYHLNFKAKEKDCPDAQVETFFAQMREHPSRVLDCCVSLGPSQELPHWKNAKRRGCCYCRGRTIHHSVEKPERLITGTGTGDSEWLYGPGPTFEDFYGSTQAD